MLVLHSKTLKMLNVSLLGYHQIRCDMIFDVNVGSLKCKARDEAGGHETEPLSAMQYACVVSRETV